MSPGWAWSDRSPPLLTEGSCPSHRSFPLCEPNTVFSTMSSFLQQWGQALSAAQQQLWWGRHLSWTVGTLLQGPAGISPVALEEAWEAQFFATASGALLGQGKWLSCVLQEIWTYLLSVPQDEQRVFLSMHQEPSLLWLKRCQQQLWASVMARSSTARWS